MKTKTEKQPKDWSPKHPAACDCKRCDAVRNRGREVLMGLIYGLAEDGISEAVPTERHADPFDVEIPALAILGEDNGAALARRHLFA